MVFCLVTLIQVSHSSTLGSNDKDDSSSRRLLVSAQDEEFSMQKPQYISRPAGAPGMPLMKAAVNGAPVYFFQPSQMAAPSNLGTPPTYVIDPRILRKAQTNTLRARMSHAQNRAQVSLCSEVTELLMKALVAPCTALATFCDLTMQYLQSLSAAADDTTSILDVAVFVFVAIGGTLLVFIRIGIPSAFVK